MKKIIFLVFFFFLSCQPSPVKIALISDSKTALEKYKKGIDFAADNINSEGGVGGHTIKIFSIDDWELLKSENFSAMFICPSSSQTIKKTLEYSESNLTPIFFLYPYFKIKGNALYFCGDILSETSFLADSAAYSLHSNNVLIVEYDENISNCFKENFQKNGGKVQIIKPAQNFVETAQIIKEIFSQETPPQILFFAGFEKEDIAQFKDLFEKVAVMAPYSFLTLNEIDSFEGALTTLVFFELDAKKGKMSEFKTNYENKFGENADNISAMGYESVFLLKQILNQKQRKGNISDSLKNSAINSELSGKLFFDNEGELNRRFSLAICDGKEIKSISNLDRSVLKNIQEKIVMKRLKK